MARQATRELPPPELDDIPAFASRMRVSKRTVQRLILQGMPVVRIGRAIRIEPTLGMAFIRGELSAS